ncbi:hypothetical protein CEG18_20285 [Pseudomonas nitroreducens]|uniref:Uncharacterized protein n=1 Tax=Pseudomonas nitroreducens TaxID=46680 RepID=A0A246F9T7_PSENT|nr:hypothetical protein CEG18_20285 [Pseudomonas nitroreducens]
MKGKTCIAFLRLARIAPAVPVAIRREEDFLPVLRGCRSELYELRVSDFLQGQTLIKPRMLAW